MSGPSPDKPAAIRSALGIAAINGGLVLLLTLLVWVLFWEARLELDPGATAVVALLIAALVSGAQFLWSWLQRQRAQ